MMTKSSNQAPSSFPVLPILDSEPPARTQREKYGALLFLGIAGLAIVLMLVGWFGYRVWAMRDVWAHVYVLNDPREPDEARIRAAFALGRDPRFEERQRWELSLHRALPALARYLLAEGVGVRLVAEDPRAYAAAVARSPDWPDWLRLALARPLARAAASGHAISREHLGELCRRNDPILRLWALYALAVQNRPDPQTIVEIEKAKDSQGVEAGLAPLLLAAIHADEPHRRAILDQAIEWDRAHHSAVAPLWKGWRLENGSLLRTVPPVSTLQAAPVTFRDRAR